MKRVLITVLLVLSLFYTGLIACTDVLVGKLASVDGSVIVTQTVDGTYDSRILIVPAADHEPGSMTPVWEWIVYADRMPLVQLGEIPQVEHTYQYFLHSYPFGNEKGLLMGETTQGGARATANSPDAIMTIEQLQAFALQRTDNARDAILLMGALAEEYGYRESCNLGECVTLADGKEAWMFEIYGVGPLWKPGDGPGAVWAAQRVPDDHISVNPNYSMIGEIDPATNRPPNVDEDHFLICDNYLDTAIELGLYDPDCGEPFIWKFVYGNIQGKAWSSRLWRVYSLFNPSGNWTYGATLDYPFSVKPDELVSVYDIIDLYRDVMADTPADMEANEAWLYTNTRGETVKSGLASPQPGAEFRNLLGIPSVRNIAVQSTSSFFINQTRDWLPPEIGAVVWFGLGNSHKAVVVPLYCANTSVPESWKIVNRSDPKIDRNAAFWAFYSVDRVSGVRYQVMMPFVEAVRKPLQERIYRMQAAVEATALALYEVDRDLAVEYLTQYTSSLMLEVEAAYWELLDTLLLKLP